MEWTECLKGAVKFIEAHLLEEIEVKDVAAAVYMSPFYFQKGFSIMTGYSVSEYIRQRRLYLAALDVLAGQEKVIDLAYKYGYSTPESFTKAFSRFHGVPPMQLKGSAGKMKVFLPLKITVTIQGGDNMDYTVEKMERMQVIGLECAVRYDSSYQEIPKLWDIFSRDYCSSGREESAASRTVERCGIGEFGICMETEDKGSEFKYLIAGRYDGGEIPEGMKVLEIPAMEWAKFCCTGPLPGALQTINTKIFHEWLPGNPDYEIAAGINLEWYSMGDCSSQDYESAIWIPVRKK